MSLQLAPVLEYLAAHCGVDLRDYRAPTLQRRLQLRLAALGILEPHAYVERLERDPSEVPLLLSTLLIGVTGFFREPAVFEALEKHVLPQLVAAAGKRPVRVWAAGVATGEEAYSLAMLLTLACERQNGCFEILATDLDPSSVERASEGCYPIADAECIPAALSSRFFVRRGDHLYAGTELRRSVRFVQHDLTAQRLAPEEAVVASFDLVSMRNVLIYLDRRLQTKVCARIGAVIEPGGVLVLGATESPPRDLPFSTYPALDSKLRIFCRRNESS